MVDKMQAGSFSNNRASNVIKKTRTPDYIRRFHEKLGLLGAWKISGHRFLGFLPPHGHLERAMRLCHPIQKFFMKET